MAGAGLTAPGSPRVPGEGGTVATVLPRCVGAARALPADLVAEGGFSPRGHRAGTVPWGSQLQPGDEGGPEEGEPTHLPWDVLTHPSHTLTTVAPWMQGTAMEARPAVGKAATMAVVQTALAVATVGVAGSRVMRIDIIVALTGPAWTPSGVSPWPRVPKASRGTVVAAGA